MNAASTVTLVNFPKSEIELIPGSTNQFAMTVSQFFGPKTSTVLEPILPYVVAVKNNSSSAIATVLVRWTSIAGTGQPMTKTGQHRLIGTSLKQGEMIMMAPISGLSVRMKGKPPTLRNQAGLATRIADTAQQFDQQSEVVISLDSVIY